VVTTLPLVADFAKKNLSSSKINHGGMFNRCDTLFADASFLSVIIRFVMCQSFHVVLFYCLNGALQSGVNRV